MTNEKTPVAPANAGAMQKNRWPKGRSGNPAGKIKGTRHKATRAVESLLEGQAEALTQKAVEMALAGDSVALRLCLDRIAPPRKGRTVMFHLPSMESVGDLLTVMDAVVRAVADGQLTTDEGTAVVGLLEAKRKVIESVELERRLAALEQSQEKTHDR